MKKIVTVIAFALLCSGAYAQFNQGRYLVGGSLGFSATTEKTKTDNATNTNSHTTSLSITPNAGYFIIDNLAVGAGLDITSQTRKDDGDDGKFSTSYAILQPFARYYFDPGIFVQGQIGFGSHKTKEVVDFGNTTQTTTTKGGVFGWGLGVGYAYFLTDNVAVEPIFSYQSLAAKDKDTDTKNVSSGVYLNIGFQIYLGPRN